MLAHQVFPGKKIKAAESNHPWEAAVMGIGTLIADLWERQPWFKEQTFEEKWQGSVISRVPFSVVSPYLEPWLDDSLRPTVWWEECLMKRILTKIMIS